MKVISVDVQLGRIRLSRRELLPLPEGEAGEMAKARMLAARESGGGPPRRSGPGGGRGGRDDRRGGGGGGRGPR